MKMYEYMINYCYPSGRGRMRITTTNTIESYKDIEKVDKVAQNMSKQPKAFVTDFKLLREYKEE